MVRPALRRALAEWAKEAYRLTERRACRAVGAPRATVRYRSVRPSQEPLLRRIREIAAVCVGAGYRPIHVYLRREGWRVNHKRNYRLYRAEGLSRRRRRPRRRRSAARRLQRELPVRPNEQWAMDFMRDTVASGTTFRVMTLIDIFSRECLATIARRSFTGVAVATLLAYVGRTRGALPMKIRVDNGTEFTSKALDHWACWNHVVLDFSRPGKPADNAFIEAFNGTLRRECLSQHWLVDFEDGQGTLDRWSFAYNNSRPHGALGQRPPALYGAGATDTQDRNQIESSPI